MSLLGLALSSVGLALLGISDVVGVVGGVGVLGSELGVFCDSALFASAEPCWGTELLPGSGVLEGPGDDDCLFIRLDCGVSRGILETCSAVV